MVFISNEAVRGIDKAIHGLLVNVQIALVSNYGESLKPGSHRPYCTRSVSAAPLFMVALVVIDISASVMCMWFMQIQDQIPCIRSLIPLHVIYCQILCASKTQKIELRRSPESNL